MIRLAVFGNPIKQSKSPAIHLAFAKQFDMLVEYSKHLVPIDGFSEHAIEFFTDPTALGCNITVPFKQDAAAWVDSLSERAEKAGAVNTIIRNADGSFNGDNTDGVGLVNDLLKHQVNLEQANILLLGAGGAARGVLLPLLNAGAASITIANRTVERAQELTHFFNDDRIAFSAFDALHDSVKQPLDLIINSTSASLKGCVPSISERVIAQASTVYDMVYSAQPTVFMQHAKALGVKNQIDGLGMLVEQAAESFYLWTGLRPDTQTVADSLRVDS